MCAVALMPMDSLGSLGSLGAFRVTVVRVRVLLLGIWQLAFVVGPGESLGRRNAVMARAVAKKGGYELEPRSRQAWRRSKLGSVVRSRTQLTYLTKSKCIDYSAVRVDLHQMQRRVRRGSDSTRRLRGACLLPIPALAGVLEATAAPAPTPIPGFRRLVLFQEEWDVTTVFPHIRA